MKIKSNHLSRSDWKTLASAVEKLHSDFDPQTLHERALAAASMVIAADSVAFTAITFEGVYAEMTWNNSETLSSADVEVFDCYMKEQPLFDAYIVKRRTDTLKITDLISAADFKRTNIYNEFYRRVGVTNQLVTPLEISKDFFMTCSINTIKEDFSERDKQILTLTAPHLANAIRNALAYRRISSTLDQECCGIVVVNSKGKPRFVSDFARELFKNYFAAERHPTDSLPETLRNWIKQIDLNVKNNEFNLPTRRLKVVDSTGQLTVRLIYNAATGERTLMLEEKKFASVETFASCGLTRREAEMLFWIIQGKTDGVIAELCGISLRTVQKHIENVYTKLGVETRTAAMLKALEIKRCVA